MDAQRARAGDPVPGQRPLGDLRPARRPGDRALHRQPPVTESEKASVAGVISLSGYSADGGGLDPHRDDRAADGLDLQRRPAARCGRAGWKARWRSGSTAGARCGRSAVRTARPAIVAGTVLAVARAIGESVMLAMVSGSVGFAPNPARRPDLHLRALSATGADDRQEHRPAQLKAGQRDAVCDRHRPALLGGDVLADRLGRTAGDEQIRGDRLMDAVAHHATGSAPRRLSPNRPGRARARSRAAPPGASRTASASPSAGRWASSSARSRLRSSSIC